MTEPTRSSYLFIKDNALCPRNIFTIFTEEMQLGAGRGWSDGVEGGGSVNVRKNEVIFESEKISLDSKI